MVNVVTNRTLTHVPGDRNWINSIEDLKLRLDFNEHTEGPSELVLEEGVPHRSAGHVSWVCHLCSATVPHNITAYADNGMRLDGFNGPANCNVAVFGDGFTNMLADVVRVLGDQEPEVPLPDFEDAYQTQRVLEAAMISAREHHSVMLDQVT